MSTKIDSPGAYIGTIADSAVSLTKKGFPQWVAVLKPTRKYISSPEEIKHFQGQGFLADGNPGWVDWSAFDEETVAYLVLYNSTEEISPQTEMLNAQQLALATGWQPPSFGTLGELVGKEILFRVEFDSYTNQETQKTTEGYKVQWIDSKDASPERQLKSLDASGIAALAQKVVGYGAPKTTAKPAAPAKPTKPAAPAAASPKPATPAVASAPSVPAPAATEPRPVVQTEPTAQPSVEKKAARTKKAPAPAPKLAPATPAAPAPATTIAGLPAEISMEDAWEYVCNHKADNEDQVVEDAWLSATGEVSGTRDVSEMSNGDWAKVRDITLKDLAA